jgi:hypothetical protein
MLLHQVFHATTSWKREVIHLGRPFSRSAAAILSHQPGLRGPILATPGAASTVTSSHKVE